jgi:hypothetical protein
MRSKKMIFTLSIFFLFLKLNTVIAFDSKDQINRSLNTFDKLSFMSDNSVSLIYDEKTVEGYQCIANELIPKLANIFRIPKKLSICAYHLFPFKFELSEWLQEINGMKETFGVDNKFGSYLLTYLLLYIKHANKDNVKNYIKSKGLRDYDNLTELDFDSLTKLIFPDVVVNFPALDEEHFKKFHLMGYPQLKGDEFEYVFNSVLSKIVQSEHAEIMIPWTSDKENFKQAFGLVLQRGIQVKLAQWYILEGWNNKKPILQSEKKNYELNQYFAKNVGANCLLASQSKCTTYIPKYNDLRDRKGIVLDTELGFFWNVSPQDIYPGQEVSYTLPQDPSNMNLFIQYGFVTKTNIHNILTVRIEDDIKLTKEKFDLCKQLNCFDASAKDFHNIPKMRAVFLRPNKIDEALLNTGRVKYLKVNEDRELLQNAYKKILSGQPISYTHEMQSWLYYYNTCKSTFTTLFDNLNQSIKLTQKYRNKVNKITRKIEESETFSKELKKDYVKNKGYENIYNLDISYKIILPIQVESSLNHLINTTQNELSKIREKYLN